MTLTSASCVYFNEVNELRFTVPIYPSDEVDWAGDVLVSGEWEKMDLALAVIGNWRSAHNYPLNTFQMLLRRKAREISDKSIVSQRIKRLSSIDAKLRMFRGVPKLRNVKLSQMQDIGGCRAVLRSVPGVYRLVKAYERSNLRHDPIDRDDYITAPKRSGYRSYHLIYQYKSDRERSSVWNGLKIELQFRSPLQHAWATAVETVGTFTRYALKSSQGDERWRRFFSLMGGAIALRERTPPVPAVPTDAGSLIDELQHYVRDLNVVTTLRHCTGVGTCAADCPAPEGGRDGMAACRICWASHTASAWVMLEDQRFLDTRCHFPRG